MNREFLMEFQFHRWLCRTRRAHWRQPCGPCHIRVRGSEAYGIRFRCFALPSVRRPRTGSAVNLRVFDEIDSKHVCYVLECAQYAEAKPTESDSDVALPWAMHALLATMFVMLQRKSLRHDSAVNLRVVSGR